jgi:DNA-binding NarL/FixJ family response regulator
VTQLRVVAAESDPSLLYEMISLLSVEFSVLGTSTDGQEALELVRVRKPDAVVLDFYLPKISGVAIARLLTMEPQSPPVVICSLEHHLMIVRAARRAGALGFVLKQSAQEDLVRAVRLALQGEFFVSPHIISRLPARAQRLVPRHPLVVDIQLADIQSGFEVAGQTVDLSLFGCRVTTQHQLPKGAKVRVTLSHDGASVEAYARVVYPAPELGVALAFTHIDSGHQHILEGWLRNLSQFWLGDSDG